MLAAQSAGQSSATWRSGRTRCSMSPMSPCLEVLCCCHRFLRTSRFGCARLHPPTGLSCFDCWQGWYNRRNPGTLCRGFFSVSLRRYWDLLAESFQDHGERLGRATSVGDDLDRVTDVLGTNVAEDSVDRGHRFAVDRGDNIPGLEPSSLRPGPRRDLDDVDALGCLDVVLLSNIGCERSSLDTQSRPCDLTVLEDGVIDLLCCIDGDGESEALRVLINHRVHSHDAAGQVDQGSSRIAG